MIKIGALSFLNALPFFNPFIEKRVPFSGEFSFGTASEVNKKLQEGSVEIGLVSSATFIQDRDKYVLLTNLGIAASKGIKSVCLYSKKELKELDGKTVAVPDSAATSTMLLKVLSEHFWHIAPKFVEAHGSLADLSKQYDAVLVIGDECLIKPPAAGLKAYDLAEEWYKYTKKPFVFALFATRVDSWIEWPDEVREFHQKLVMAYDYTTNNFHDLITCAQKMTGLSVESLEKYYKGLDYYLDSNHFQGLEQFAALNQKCTL